MLILAQDCLTGKGVWVLGGTPPIVLAFWSAYWAMLCRLSAMCCSLFLSSWLLDELVMAWTCSSAFEASTLTPHHPQRSTSAWSLRFLRFSLMRSVLSRLSMTNWSGSLGFNR